MRIAKKVKLTWNGDSDKAIECSLEYDGWCFNGTKEEVLEQVESLLGQLEIDCEESK